MIPRSQATAKLRRRICLSLGLAFMAVNGFFVALVPGATRPELAGISAAFVLVLAAPSVLALVRGSGKAVAIRTFLALGSFAVLIEAFALLTGFPYGHFEYGQSIGFKYFGLVPWTVFFAWPPLVLGAIALASHSKSSPGPRGLVIRSTLWLLAFDLVLDPGAVHQKFWTYLPAGPYYGVPLSNYAGWLLSGTVGSALALLCLGRWNVAATAPLPTGMAVSAALVVTFWSSVCLFAGLTLPALAGLITLLRLCLILDAS